MPKLSIPELEKKANEIRRDIIKMLVRAGSGHSAGPLGMADVFTALYFQIMNHDPKNPDWPERDRLLLSNGHIVPVRYAAMAQAGYFPVSELATLRKLGTRLQGHPERLRLPGVETTSGPLGSGLAQAAGYAYAARMDGARFRVFCITSDGEHQSGNHWEAVMFAGKYNLSNLTAIVDRNNIQIDGYTEEVMPLEPLEEKYKAFNWNVIPIDGHNFQEIIDAVEKARAVYENPTVIIAHTIPGKGVSYMESDFKWHGTPPGITDMPGEPSREEQVKIALNDLRTLKGKIKSEHE
ncbi:MAG: Transketolase domain protein [Candidatus Woesebacteria bacterium GW2011_GWC2_47_16]|uniref:Transketolase domain protein n=9 Tax=Candidatus Woeseibacteriota TaxID=1752722 RepID=A0A0G1QRP5_9BACT|nr:MAG: Transketolase domain protein [Candidatus Woesebacteria bacterium GW2011_GWE1_45_18]KKU25098.1 MAG: Transketolase domain protein [Candidatus Woesebacteria bacterium GW2011_GWF1_46_13]KKU47641.1 MAG: Transketolase domain protein [Candidatus Woesebacteria bacterium GW2011_GWF2_46_8]KKU65321.1 MAG: Transketolase domain protein [Candidatus Woesebacteria bacterium GW2011_GWC2_47_16]KKU71260.1 MAG: Transketolase domain protein [Candidatus Woesebacteria bacterium GW2011_GWD1_47_21]OGM77296.1 M